MDSKEGAIRFLDRKEKFTVSEVCSNFYESIDRELEKG